MRSLTVIVGLMLLVGCASGSQVGKGDQSAPPSLPPAAATIGSDEDVPAAAAVTAEPGESLDAAGLLSDAELEARCDKVAELAEDGQLKPAVDELASLQDLGIECPESVVEVARQSREVLAEADDLIRDALAKRDRDDLIGARAGLSAALDLYPKYYWAEMLQHGVEESIETVAAELAAAEGAETVIGPQQPETGDGLSTAENLRKREVLARNSLAYARDEEQKGDLDQAEKWIQLALDLLTGDADLRAEVVESARLVGLSLFSAGELTRAKLLWSQALALDEGNAKLLEYLTEVEERLEGLLRIKGDDNSP